MYKLISKNTLKLTSLAGISLALLLSGCNETTPAPTATNTVKPTPPLPSLPVFSSSPNAVIQSLVIVSQNVHATASNTYSLSLVVRNPNNTGFINVQVSVMTKSGDGTFFPTPTTYDISHIKATETLTLEIPLNGKYTNTPGVEVDIFPGTSDQATPGSSLPPLPSGFANPTPFPTSDPHTPTPSPHP